MNICLPLVFIKKIITRILTIGCLVGFVSANADVHLSNWFNNGLTGKKICFVGDSTTSNANRLFKELNGFYVKEGEALYGVQSILNFGENGASLRAFLFDRVRYGVTAAIAEQADLYVISYGINDVRLGQTTEDQLVDMLVDAVDMIRASVPDADIVLSMPGSFLSADINGYGYVQPNSKAPAYSTLLRNAYKRLESRWDNVAVIDTQELVYGRASPASSVYMADQIHPSSAGYTLLAKILVDLIGQKQPYKPRLQENDAAADLFLPLNPNYYNLVATGRWVASSEAGASNGYVDLGWPQNKSGDIRCGDILQMAGNYAFTIPPACRVAALGGNTRIYNLGGTLPQVTATGGMVNIWRVKYDLIATGRWVASSVAGAANGYVDFEWPQSKAGDIQCGDLMQMTGSQVFVLPPRCNILPIYINTLRVFNLGESLPPATITGGSVNILRLKN